MRHEIIEAWILEKVGIEVLQNVNPGLGLVKEGQVEISAIDGKSCEQAFIRSGRDPRHLARFLRKYPAAFYLSWVKSEIAKWGAGGDFDSLKLLQPGRGERKFETGQMQVFIDFLIYNAVIKLKQQGYTLTNDQNGIFRILSVQPFLGTVFSWQHIRDRYYRFLHHQAVIFIDDEKKMIFGPGRVVFAGCSFIGFLEYAPASGFKLITPK